MTRIALLSTSDTDLLSARMSGADYLLANPSKAAHAEMVAALEASDLVVVRLLGSPRDLCSGFARFRAAGKPMVVVGGEQLPDAALMEQSTVPIGVAAEAHVYLAQGGPANLRELHAFLSDTVLLTGVGFEPPAEQPVWGQLERSLSPSTSSGEPPSKGPGASAIDPSTSSGRQSTGSGHQPTGSRHQPTGSRHQPTGSGHQPTGSGHQPTGSGHQPTGSGHQPRVGILFYRAQYAAGNTAYVEALADAVDAAGGVAVPIFAASLRDAPADLLERLGTLDALITTVLAAGGTRPATASAGEEDEGWDVRALAALDIPILQGLCLTAERAWWEESAEGMSPLDVATQVAVPEFDGRLITVPFSFKETDADGLPHYVADHERCRRVAEIAINHARLRHIPPAERKIAIVLSAYPTKHARIGNAVGLDTPVSVIRLLRALREHGYDLGAPGEFPGTGPIHPVEGEEPDTTAGNALIHALIDAGGQDPEWLTAEQLSGQPVRIPAATYREWLAELPPKLTRPMIDTWGDAPGDLFVDRSRNPAGEIVAATLQAGNVVILVQPPRGFGENPIAIYHDPDLAPTHHYMAVYRWIERDFGAHAIVHMGKHGNLEWLPGKNLGQSAACATDAALGSVPLIYPFLVNDPGEGTQAKRRAHATIVDHLVPPMARAESYGDIARLEQLLDEYGNVAAMDPAKAPALQGEIWTLIQAAQLHHDLGLTERPDDEEFGEFVMHVDGWLCEIKDVQIRDGLHVLGQAPIGEGLVNLVLAILRSNQVFGGQVNGVPGLRAALGLVEGSRAEPSTGSGEAPRALSAIDPSTGSGHQHFDPSTGSGREVVDAVEAQAKTLVEAVAEAGWRADAVPRIVADTLRQAQGADIDGVEASLRFACEEVVPRLAKTSGEIDAVLHALDGGYVPAGPSGSPLRGLVNVLPTGRNFYSVDPKAIPSRLAFQTGQAMADSLLARYLADTGDYPRSVGLSVWGTSAMRTSGDDIAEVFALLGVLPVWDEMSRRVVGLDVVSLAELGRPRIDVTVRISGFFRDAFPHVVAMLDDAVRLVADLDEPHEQNFVRAHAAADLAAHGDHRRATTRIFGSKPGSYGAGILPLMEAGNWRDNSDIAEVYTTWGGFAYGRDLDGAPARDDLQANYRRINVAAKNIDTREHDIADSDDYFQYHGGMIATVRALTGSEPVAYVGDSTSPDAVRTRTLTEETSRVFRARVVNPRWIAAMQRHGYKGAFELAATVDYLFGFDATAGVVPDWMYEQLSEKYVLDKENQDFMRAANPWALNGIIEKLTEAVDRGLWEEPDPELMAELQRVYLDVEGDLEDRV